MDMFSRRFVSVPTTESNPIWPRSITFIKYTSKDGPSQIMEMDSRRLVAITHYTHSKKFWNHNMKKYYFPAGI